MKYHTVLISVFAGASAAIYYRSFGQQGDSYFC